MNSCVLMAEIVEAPQLRYTNNDAMLAFAEMWVQFPGLRADDPPASLRVVGWGNLAQDIQQNYQNFVAAPYLAKQGPLKVTWTTTLVGGAPS